MTNIPLPRIDLDSELQKLLLPYSRFIKGKIWKDRLGRHKIGCIDIEDIKSLKKIAGNEKPTLSIQDPPYNFVAFKETDTKRFINWCKKWVDNIYSIIADDSAFYVWLGADQKNGFSPLPEFMAMMKQGEFKSKSFITLRNQRGYGTQKNWMSIRQELLLYEKGKPNFNINAEYTDIPKILKGYYKTVKGKETENLERSNSGNIRAGNVWIDIQQVFYRMEENVNGCFAQKPLKAIERIINAGSKKNDVVIDFFSHSGTTLIACEKLDRRCFTTDIDPIFCEITLRRLENFRKTGKTGWQNSNPFAEEIENDKKIKSYLSKVYDLQNL
ncbi:MAG: site-specific DNA-methyltransferase [Ignavibacteriales bacterium CG_4_9_14_3_um_filter_30_11]|nr:MAG: site-specific DNA-methyltransferase [Ignavibacteriales bacterium CG_4_9_14_3_um_filter_30_11]